MKRVALLVVLLQVLLVSQGVNGVYQIVNSYTGTNFFDGWNFFSGGDPTHGYVNYVNRATAQQQGLINANASEVYIGCDYKNVASGNGRSSVRLTSQKSFTDGLFIADLSHMPTGCGTWPAWWTVGPNWPSGGEIDVIEGVNVQNNDQTTLHTNPGCTMAGEDKSKFSGNLVNADCQGNQGCGIQTGSGTYGASFNSHQGGVFAMEWTQNYIQTFYWPRNSIPADVAKTPNPAGWGKPYAYFQFGNNCPASHFQNHQIVIDLTFCGDWAGAVFGNDCPGKGSCNDYVKNNPAAFKEAYWVFHYVNVFKNQ